MSSQLNILVVSTTLPRFAGDPEPRFVLDLARAMGRDHKVTILAPGDCRAMARDSVDRVDIRRFRYFPLRRFELLAYPGGVMPKLKANKLYWLLVPPLIAGMTFALLREIARKRYDVIHCHWIVPQGAICGLLGFLPGFPPYVLTSHGGDIIRARNSVVVRTLCQLALSRAAGVSAVSHQIASEIVQISNVGRDVPVIPMGVDTVYFSRDRGPMPESVNCLPGPYVVFVGRLCEKKGLIYLVRAMAAASLAAASLHLVVAGDGPERNLIEAEIRRLQLESRVCLLGSIPHDQLVGLMRNAIACCVPSVVASDGDRDGTPTVLFEAFAAQTACVASRVAGIPDVMEHEVNGLIVEPHDAAGIAAACHRLLVDSALRRRLVDNASADLSRYDWKTVADRHMRMLGPNSGGRNA